jgi:type II secretory pathway pseudopilin PulG
MLPNSVRDECGFTLVEALVAATIVAVAIVAVAHLAAVGIRQSAISARTLIALAEAQGKLEQLAVGAISVGSGDEIGAFRLRWTIAPVASVDPSILSLTVCAYESTSNDRPEACVATLRANRP